VVSLALLAGKSGFNPRPPSLAGDPHVVMKFGKREEVSIRARHHWRAILGHCMSTL